MDWITVAISLVIAALAAIWDIRTGKIPNFLTFPSMLFGTIYACAMGTETGLERILLLVVLFVIGSSNIFGMGDLKLIMAIGALNGIFCIGITVAFAAFMVIIMDVIRNRQKAWIDIKAGYRSLSELKFDKRYGTERSVKFAPYLFVGLVIGVILCRFFIN